MREDVVAACPKQKRLFLGRCENIIIYEELLMLVPTQLQRNGKLQDELCSKGTAQCNNRLLPILRRRTRENVRVSLSPQQNSACFGDSWYEPKKLAVQVLPRMRDMGGLS